MRTFTFGLCPDHSIKAGTGVSFGSILSTATSGSIRVCGLSLRSFTCKRLDGGAASFSWRLSACLSAHSILELPAGTICESQSQPGDLLEFSPAEGRTGSSETK